MLDFFRATSRNCQGTSRRAFLRVGALSGLGLSLPGLFAGRQAAAAQGKKTKDMSCILIWTLAHNEFGAIISGVTRLLGEYPDPDQWRDFTVAL